jgi:hypothetical protein
MEVLEMLLRQEGKRRLRLRHMTNEELIQHYDADLLLRLYNKKDLSDARKMIARYLVSYLNGLPPSVETAKSFISQIVHHAGVAEIAYPYKNWAEIIRQQKPTIKITLEQQPGTTIHLQPTHISRPPGRVRPSHRKSTGGLYASKSGAMSHHYFRGSRRVG